MFLREIETVSMRLQTVIINETNIKDLSVASNRLSISYDLWKMKVKIVMGLLYNTDVKTSTCMVKRHQSLSISIAVN